MFIRVVLVIIGFMVFGLSFSQTCCSGGVPLSNNLGMPNEGAGFLQLRLNYDYNNLNTLNAGRARLDDDSRKRITNSLLLGVGYSITDRWSLETLFSWVNQSRIINQFDAENLTETNGVGDAVLLLKHAFPGFLGPGAVLSLGAGVKAPLGRSDLTTSEGFQLTADLQPGSGAWDAIGWLSLYKDLGFRPSATVSGSFTYRFTGENKDYLNNSATYEFGNVLQVNLGYTDQLLVANTIIRPGLVFKYRKALEDRIDDSDVPNTGGEWIFLRPEVAVAISPQLALTTQFELPLYSFVEGTQLTPTFRFTAGMYFNLSLKKNDNIIQLP